jgi:hypothetical protein
MSSCSSNYFCPILKYVDNFIITPQYEIHENSLNGSRASQALSGIQRDRANLIDTLLGCECTQIMDYK